MKKHLVVMFLIISACTQQPVKTTQNPNIKMVSTFDVALDMKSQKQLESEFDNYLNPKNLDTWMKHLSLIHI